MPAIAAAYRARILANPDLLDRLFTNPATVALAHREATARRVQIGADQ